MDARDLKCFSLVYKERSLNRAAGKLHISSQGLSRVIVKLENELNAKLFIRTQMGVTPTECADFLYQSAQVILKQFKEIENGVRQLAQKYTHLRIACAGGVLNALSFELILLSFMKANPDFEVEWVECSNQEARGRVLGLEADVGLIIGSFDEENIVQACLAKRQIVLLVHKSHPFYEKESVTISDLTAENIIIPNKNYRINEEFRLKCETIGFVPNIVAETVDMHLLYKLCRVPIGVGILIDFSIDHFDMRNMKVIPFQDDFTWDVYSIIHTQNVELPLIRAFQKHLSHI